MSSLAVESAAISSGPPRPDGVPLSASWIEMEREWQERQTDSEGRLHGRFRSWRPDGSTRTVCHYQSGKQVGVVWTFHPDGSLFFSGCYSAGKERGVHRKYATPDPDGERLQSCCVPPGAWQLRDDYSTANGLGRAWFNRDGQRLTGAGELYPSRPPGVPIEAWFNEELRAWESGVVFEKAGYTGTRRLWSVEGVLLLIEGLNDGARQGALQSFDASGVLEWAGHFIDGRLSGPYQARYAPGTRFANPGLCGLTGSFEQGRVRDLWRYLGPTGAVVLERDLGRPVEEGSLSTSPAFGSQRLTAAGWRAISTELFADRRMDEALIAAARASASARDAVDVTWALERSVVPLSREVAVREARQVLQDPAASPVTILDALKQGVDAATLLWGLAKILPDRDRVGLDLVSAATLLDPSSREYLATRALMHGALGDLEAARADVTRLAEESPEQAAFLHLYLRVYFPRFTFWPARESFPGSETDASADPVADPGALPGPLVDRSVVEVRRAIQTYATRLGRLRAALMVRLREERASPDLSGDAGSGQPRPNVDDEPFMIPDLSALLPEGPVPISRFTFEMSAEEFEGEPSPDPTSEEDASRPSTVEITVDETGDMMPVPSGILRILRRARSDWSGLTWLCWAIGLDAPGLPERLCPRAAFASAAIMTVERTWRCQDKIRTSGLMALTKGIVGFDWEDCPIDLVPSALIDVALDEYLEARAVFSWLCDRSNRSPWQNDLRDPDT